MSSLPAVDKKNRPDRQALRARWIFPVDRPPIENATIEIVANRITAVTTRHVPSAIDLGNVAIVPGLVNAHTHLELSDAGKPLEPSAPFTHWLKAVMAHRCARPNDTETAAHEVFGRGLHETTCSGTTLLGDIVSAEWRVDFIPPQSARLVSFLELLGLSRDRIEPQLVLARNHLQHELCGDEAKVSASHVRGISPHAPYSVHPELFAKLIQLAHEFRAPLAMHLAETPAEVELLESGTGEFAGFLRDIGVWQPWLGGGGRRILEFLKAMAPLENPLAIHGNYFSAEEIEFLARSGTISVVYCPRTHAFFSHSRHPWLQLLARGVNVALGTDSRASNPDLSLWNELLFLRQQYPDVTPSLLLEMGTISGARALGFSAETGSLTPGKAGDLAIVSLPESGSTDPYGLLFDPKSRAASIHAIGLMDRTGTAFD